MKNEDQTILIVDDVAVSTRILSQLLSPLCRILVANNGQQALDIIAKTNLDLVLLDIQLPDMSGYAICRKIKSQPKTNNIPIIFITAKDSAQDEAYGLELGASDYITKPYSIPIVMARVRNQLLYKQKTDLLEKLVSLDGLTEIPNRRYFDDCYQRDWHRCWRTQSYCSVMMIDIDFFKPFNDNYGHRHGDDCLKNIALTLKSQLKRGGDFVARYGGEEFVVVLTGEPLANTLVVANNLLESIDALQITHDFSQVTNHVTISIGFATTIPSHKQHHQLIEIADQQLYLAKQQGRHQIVSTYI